MNKDRLKIGGLVMILIAVIGAMFFSVNPSPYLAGALVLLFMSYAS
jgi:hypothetical protein